METHDALVHNVSRSSAPGITLESFAFPWDTFKFDCVPGTQSNLNVSQHPLDSLGDDRSFCSVRRAFRGPEWRWRPHEDWIMRADDTTAPEQSALPQEAVEEVYARQPRPPPKAA